MGVPSDPGRRGSWLRQEASWHSEVILWRKDLEATEIAAETSLPFSSLSSALAVPLILTDRQTDRPSMEESSLRSFIQENGC